jgi:hypothetical protein
MKKLLIIGQGKHGKDELARILLENHGRTYMSSSQFACDEFIYEALKDEYGYSSPEECHIDRHNHRDLWFNMISDYNKEDPARLAKNLLSKVDVYVGMRSAVELAKCKEEGLFSAIIWVDASKRVDYREPVSSNQITEEDADVVMENNGSIAQFETNTAMLVNEVFPHVGA